MNRLKLITNLFKESMKNDDMMTKIKYSLTVLTCIKTKETRLILIMIILI